MRVRALLLSIIFMFGEISAGQAAFVVPIIVAGISAASGRPTRCGFACDGGGGNFRTESSFSTKDGTTFTSRSDAWDQYKPDPNAWKYSDEKVKEEFEARRKYEEEHKFKEEKIDADSIDDIEDFVFWKEEGRSYSRFTSEKESYDCMMDGDKIFLSTSGSRSFGVEPYDGFDSFSTFTPDTEEGRKAVKSFIFEETPLVWHFDRKNINGKWFNHAWTDSNEDYLIPEGQKFYIIAPEWYTEKRHAEAKARQDAEAQAKINENVGRGFFEEFLWANVKAVNSVFKDDHEAGRDAINQGMSYYDYAMNAWNNPELNCFSEQGMENIREFGASRISGNQFLDSMWKDLLEIGIGAAYGAASGGPAGMATGAAVGGLRAGGLRAGVKIGARYLKSEALQRLKKLFEAQPKYAYAGGPSSNFKNFANFRKPANNAPRNAKGSGGKGPNDVHEPKMRDVKGIGKDKGQSEKIRAEREYGKGKYWNELSRNANLSKKSKGQTRVDAEGDAYKFDPKHKTTKVHLHRYRHKGGNKWKLIEEVDPETGETIRSINGDVEIWG